MENNINESQLFNNARQALAEINEYNHIRNDLDAYLFDLAEWGLGLRKDRPNKKDFGL